MADLDFLAQQLKKPSESGKVFAAMSDYGGDRGGMAGYQQKLKDYETWSGKRDKFLRNFNSINRGEGFPMMGQTNQMQQGPSGMGQHRAGPPASKGFYANALQRHASMSGAKEHGQITDPGTGRMGEMQETSMTAQPHQQILDEFKQWDQAYKQYGEKLNDMIAPGATNHYFALRDQVKTMLANRAAQPKGGLFDMGGAAKINAGGGMQSAGMGDVDYR